MTTHSDRPSDDEFVFDDESNLQHSGDVGGPLYEDQVDDSDDASSSMNDVDFVLDEEFFDDEFLDDEFLADDGTEFVLEEIEDSDLFESGSDGDFVLEYDDAEADTDDAFDTDANELETAGFESATFDGGDFEEGDSEDGDFADGEVGSPGFGDTGFEEAGLEAGEFEDGDLQDDTFEDDTFEDAVSEAGEFETIEFEPIEFESAQFEDDLEQPVATHSDEDATDVFDFEATVGSEGAFLDEGLDFADAEFVIESDPAESEELVQSSFGTGRHTEFQHIADSQPGDGEDVDAETVGSADGVYGEISLRQDGDRADFAEWHDEQREAEHADQRVDDETTRRMDEQEALASMFDAEARRRQASEILRDDDLDRELFATPPAEFSENGFDEDGGLSAGQRVAAIGDFDLEPSATDDDYDSMDGFDTDAEFEVESIDGEAFDDEVELLADSEFGGGATRDFAAQTGFDSGSDSVELEPELVDEVGHSVHSVLDETVQDSDPGSEWSDDLELVLVDEEEQGLELDEDVRDFEDIDEEEHDPIYGEDDDEEFVDEYEDEEADYEELQPIIKKGPFALRVIGGGRGGSGWRAAAAAAVVMVAAGIGGIVALKPGLLGLGIDTHLVDVTEVARPRLAIAPGEPVLPLLADVETPDPGVDEPADPELPTTSTDSVATDVPEGPTTEPESGDPETTEPIVNPIASIDDPETTEPESTDPAIGETEAADPFTTDPELPTTPADPIAVVDTPRVEGVDTGNAPVRLAPLRLGTDLEAQELGRELPSVVAAVSPGDRALARLANASVFVGRVKKLEEAFVTLDLSPGEVSLRRDELEVLVPVDLANAEGPTLQRGEVRLRNTERFVGRVVRPEGRGVVAIETDSARILVPLGDILEVRSRTPGDTDPILDEAPATPSAAPVRSAGR